jgi:hypothetical protein
MAYLFQTVVDCADPHTLADWWADMLGWTVEDPDEAFIKDMIAQGYATDADTRVHRGRLVWREGAAIHHPDDSGPSRRRVLFQEVPEPKTVKNRMHIDVRVGADKVDEEVARLVAAGATVDHEGHQGPHRWITIHDPEGNELCIS